MALCTTTTPTTSSGKTKGILVGFSQRMVDLRILIPNNCRLYSLAHQGCHQSYRLADASKMVLWSYDMSFQVFFRKTQPAKCRQTSPCLQSLLKNEHSFCHSIQGQLQFKGIPEAYSRSATYLRNPVNQTTRRQMPLALVSDPFRDNLMCHGRLNLDPGFARRETPCSEFWATCGQHVHDLHLGFGIEPG